MKIDSLQGLSLYTGSVFSSFGWILLPLPCRDIEARRDRLDNFSSHEEREGNWRRSRRIQQKFCCRRSHDRSHTFRTTNVVPLEGRAGGGRHLITAPPPFPSQHVAKRCRKGGKVLESKEGSSRNLEENVLTSQTEKTLVVAPPRSFPLFFFVFIL